MKNSKIWSMKIHILSQLLSLPPTNGQTVNPSKKSEINPLVDHAGLSELLKLCPIDSVLVLDKKTKPDSQPKIWTPVVHLVETGVVEVIHHLLGLIIKTPDLYLEIFMEITNGVLHIVCLHVLTTKHHQIIQTVHQLNTTLHLVKKHVHLNLDFLGVLISKKDHQPTLFLESQTSKQNSWPTDHVKPLWTSMPISKPTEVEFINIALDLTSEDTLSNY